MKNKQTNRWYNQRAWALILALGALIGAYFVALRALDTANMWQYLATFVLAGFGLNRLFRAILPKKGNV